MYVRGSASTTRGAGGGPSRPSRTSARALCLENRHNVGFMILDVLAERVGEHVEDHEADVVPVPPVRRARIPEPDDQKWVHLLLGRGRRLPLGPGRGLL